MGSRPAAVRNSAVSDNILTTISPRGKPWTTLLGEGILGIASRPFGCDLVECGSIFFVCPLFDLSSFGALPLLAALMATVDDEAGLDPRSDNDSLYEDAPDDAGSLQDDTCASRTAFGLPYQDGDRMYTELERDNFHPHNVTPNRPCTAFFRPSTYLDAKDVFDALERDGFPANSISCLHRKLSGEIFVTFRTLEMRNAFLRRSSFIVRRGRYATNDGDNSILYLTVYDAPYELPHTVIISRLLEYCSVIGQRRGRHHSQPTIFNGLRHYRIQLKRDGVSVPSFLRFGMFLLRFTHAGQTPTCRKCNRSGHLAATCNNVLCFNCDQLGHVARECPNAMLCCLCKSSTHLAKTCPAAWNNSRRPGQSAERTQQTLMKSDGHQGQCDEASQPQDDSTQPDQTSRQSDETTGPLESSVTELFDADPQSDSAVADDPLSSVASGLHSECSGLLDSQGLIKDVVAVDQTAPSSPSGDCSVFEASSTPVLGDSSDPPHNLSPVFSPISFLSPSSLPSHPGDSEISVFACEGPSRSLDSSKLRDTPVSAIPRPQRGKSFRRKPAPVADVDVPRRATKPTPVISGKSSHKSSASQSGETGEPMDSSESRKRKNLHQSSDDAYEKHAPT